jgi:phage/plasmid primase-like uncharacterized protein
MTNTADFESQFCDALKTVDIVPPQRIIADGKLHRCDAAGRNGQGDAAYLLFVGDKWATGGFQNWQAGGEWIKWKPDRAPELTAQERAAWKAKRAEAAKAAAEAKRRHALEAQATAVKRLEESSEAEEDHAYLQHKGVGAHGLTEYNGDLFVPMRDINGALQNVQTIKPDGDKRFLWGGRKQGCYHMLGELGPVICVAEGFATAATIRETTGLPVAIAFDAWNLASVALPLARKGYRICICADDDWKTTRPTVNPGRTKALELYQTLKNEYPHAGHAIALPYFPPECSREDKDTDFNDLAERVGLDAVKATIERALEPSRSSTNGAQPPDGYEYGVDYDQAPPPTGEPKQPPTVKWRDRIINARDLCDRRFPDVKHLIPDLVPEGVFLLVSRPKLGKSWLLLQTASAIALGNRLFAADNLDMPPICGDVLHLALEDSDRRIQRRMTKHFGANRENWPARMAIATTWERVDKGGLDDIREWARSVPNPTLVTIDTLEKIRPRRKPNTDPYAADYAAFEGLVEFAHEFPGLTIMVAHHDRKMGADDVFDTVSGTLGLTGSVDTVAIFKSAPNGQASLHIRGRDLESDVEKAFRFDRETGRWVMLGDAADVLRSETQAAVLDVLKRAEKDGMTVADILDEVEFPSRNAAQQALRRMADDGNIVRLKRGRYAVP